MHFHTRVRLLPAPLFLIIMTGVQSSDGGAQLVFHRVSRHRQVVSVEKDMDGARKKGQESGNDSAHWHSCCQHRRCDVSLLLSWYRGLCWCRHTSSWHDMNNMLLNFCFVKCRKFLWFFFEFSVYKCTNSMTCDDVIMQEWLYTSGRVLVSLKTLIQRKVKIKWYREHGAIR